MVCQLKKVDLRGADLTGADLTGADLTGAFYDNDTKWSKDFDPTTKKMIGPKCDLKDENLSEKDTIERINNFVDPLTQKLT